MSDAYRAFLEAKKPVAEDHGFDVDPADINPLLKPHIRAVTPWALRGGRRALFARFGMQKTTAHLEWMRLVQRHTGQPTLIGLPLGARLSFFHDAQAYFQDRCAIRLSFIRRDDEIDPAAINLTNFESIREGKVDPRRFGGTSLDEADILRGFGGTKTFREFMRVFSEVPYRFVATATPDPNEYIELLAYAAFLGIMDVGEGKTRFFKRDSTKADKLTLHPHKEKEFWLWVSTWGLFLQKPSDLGPEFSDEGYELPELDVRWHEIPTDHSGAGAERDGQARMFRNAAAGVSESAKEKRDSLPARIAKLMEIRDDHPEAHRLLWHDLEAERHAIEKSVPEVATVYGSQDLDDREALLADFAAGKIRELGGKPVMIGAGGNYQFWCWWAVFLGIGHKFRDFIQAVHRIQRYGQTFHGFRGERPRVRLDLIYTEAEREIRRNLQAKWRRYEQQAARMSEIIREYGLAQSAIKAALSRCVFTGRAEASGTNWRMVHGDCVEETRRMSDNSVDLIVTSIPFGTQYEYSPTYNDFGHTDDNAHFWRQMDFLTPELLRVLKPGRNAFIHVKDRIVPGGLNGLGFQTVNPFSDETVAHFRAHGFAFLGRKTIVTDVVRENNATYRLGWSEQCKDGTRMGAGMPEYYIVLRKPPSDSSNGYADAPVVKQKPLCDDHGEAAAFDEKRNWKQPLPGTGYSRALWQFDAHGFTRSSGDRLISPSELKFLPHDMLYKLWRDRSTNRVYSFAGHLQVAEELDHLQKLPATFMLLPPHSWHPDVWTDYARMRSLNTSQAMKGREQHLCPLPFDLVDRVIVQCSMPGEIVFDPFAGIGTVPYCAIKLGRRGHGVEISDDYFPDAALYCTAAENEMAVPSLFDLLDQEKAA